MPLNNNTKKTHYWYTRNNNNNTTMMRAICHFRQAFGSFAWYELSNIHMFFFSSWDNG